MPKSYPNQMLLYKVKVKSKKRIARLKRIYRRKLALRKKLQVIRGLTSTKYFINKCT